MSNKISAMLIHLDYYRIKKEIHSYRLGQHFCNVIGMRDTLVDGMDIFFVENDHIAANLFYDMCDIYQWDTLDLPIFGEYDISTIKIS